MKTLQENVSTAIAAPTLRAVQGLADVATSEVRGSVQLDQHLLRRLRQARLLSQEALAEQCWQQRIRLSIASIKRAETGKPVLLRTAREMARYYGISAQVLLGALATPASASAALLEAK